MRSSAASRVAWLLLAIILVGWGMVIVLVAQSRTSGQGLLILPRLAGSLLIVSTASVGGRQLALPELQDARLYRRCTAR
jgi:hypothetical protein